MNILVSTFNYLLFTYFYSILHIHHNTPLFITIPTNPTRISFPFPATPPTKVGIDRKLVRRRSSSCHPCRKKNQFDSNSTWISFPFLATIPAKVGTDRKLVRRRSCSCHPYRRKPFGKLPIEALKSCGIAASIHCDFADF